MLEGVARKLCGLPGGENRKMLHRRRYLALSLTLLVAIGCSRDQQPAERERAEPPPEDFEIVRGTGPEQFSPEDVATVRERLQPVEPRVAVTAFRPATPFREWTVRETAADALARIGKPAVPALVRTLDDPDANARVQAANALARLGPAAADAVPALTEALDDPDPLVRQAAARALGQIGPAAESAIPALVEILREPSVNEE